MVEAAAQVRVRSRRRHTRPVDRRAQILDAAESQFARFGFGATRLQPIADEVGIRVASLYNHFASKDELYAAVLERALEPVFAMLDDSLGNGEIDDPVSGLMVASADLYAAHPAIVHLFQHEMLVGFEDMHPLMRGWLAKLSEAGRAHLERLYVGPDRWAEDEIPLLQIAMFNAVCGYFTAAPLHLLLTGEQVGSTRALARQREFLRKVEWALMGFRASPERVTSDENGEH